MTSRARIAAFLFLALATSIAIQAQPLHESLGALALVGDEELPLEGPGHVKVAQKGGRPSVEGAISLVEAALDLAAWNASHGEPAQAMAIIEAGLKQKSKDRQLLLFAATISLRLDDPERALEFIKRGLKQDSDAELHYLHGKALHRLGRSEPALDALLRAVGLEPDNPRYQCGLGGIYYVLGHTEQAIEAFRKAEVAGGGSPHAAYNLGALLAETGRHDEALSVYRDALPRIVEDPAQPGASLHAKAFANSGAIFLRMHDWERALQAYGKALQLDPTVSGADYNQAYLHYRDGQVELAESGYRRALELDAALPLAYLHLGEIENARGEPKAAIQWLEQGSAFFEDDASNHRALVLLGDSHRSLGDVRASIQAYRSALDQNPEDPAALLALGALLRGEGDLAEARSLLERARRGAPESSSIALELASLARAEGNPAEEMALYREVLALEGEGEVTWWVQLNLAMLLVKAGETEEARQRLEPLLERFPSAGAEPGSTEALSSDSASVLATAYGMLVAKEGNLDDAARRFEAVLQKAEDFTPALEALAVLAALDGNLSDAEMRLTELLARVEPEASQAPKAIQASSRGSSQASSQASSQTMLHGNLGLVLWLDRRHNEARAHLQSAIQTFPGWLSVRAALAETALLAGNFASAIEHASEAFRLCTSDVDAAGAALRADEAQPAQMLQITLGGARGTETSLCKRISRSLGAVLVTTAAARLDRAATNPEVRTRIGGLLDRAAALPLAPPDKSRALFTRGTLSLLDGADGSASQDLTKALAGDLGEPLRSMAENNLGIALYNLGQTSEAERHFEAARKSTQAFSTATLNLGIALDERNENRDALRFYEEYLSSSVPGSRQSEVTAWIDHLRRIYR